MPTTYPDLSRHFDLVRFSACRDAREWAAEYATLEDAWAACNRPDWLLWLAGRVGVAYATIVLAGCACAREALVFIPEGEDRPRLAIEAAEAFARGGVDAPTVSMVSEAARAARVCGVQTGNEARSDAAFAAASTAYGAAYGAFDAADYAVDAAAAAADAADPATDLGGLARTAFQVKLAEIVRTMIPWSTIDAGLNTQT